MSTVTLNKNVSVRTNPLYLSSTQAAALTLAFQELGFGTPVYTPASPESGADDPSVFYTSTIQINFQLVDGTKYGFNRQFIVPAIDSDISVYTRRVKTMVDGFYASCLRQTIIWLAQDKAAYEAGTFTPPAGQTMDQYVDSILDAASQIPGIDV